MMNPRPARWRNRFHDLALRQLVNDVVRVERIGRFLMHVEETLLGSGDVPTPDVPLQLILSILQ